jgi:hypothetical protein
MKAIIITAMILAATPVRAEDSSYDILMRLSLILGSEKACGLQLNKSAIYQYIDKNVNGDASFVLSLKSLTEGNASSIAALSRDELAAHCSQVRRAAAKLGFIGNEK